MIGISAFCRECEKALGPLELTSRNLLQPKTWIPPHKWPSLLCSGQIVSRTAGHVAFPGTSPDSQEDALRRSWVQPHVSKHVLAWAEWVFACEISPDRTHTANDKHRIFRLRQNNRHNDVFGPVVTALGHEKLPAKVCPVPGTTSNPYWNGRSTTCIPVAANVILYIGLVISETLTAS